VLSGMLRVCGFDWCGGVLIGVMLLSRWRAQPSIAHQPLVTAVNLQV
jgi:hypothetical protein